MTYTFDKNSANRIVDAVRKLEQQTSGGILRDTGTQLSNDGGFYARIVSQHPILKYHYAFIMVGHDGGSYYEDKDVSSIRIDQEDQYLALEINGNEYVPNDTIVRLYLKGYDEARDLKLWYGFSWVSVGSTFAVKVTSDGGVAGDDTTDCTLTYSCKRLKSEVIDPPILDANVSPLRKRYPKITYSIPEADSIGVATYLPAVGNFEDIHFGPQNIFKLLYAIEEIEDTDVCVPE